MIFIKFFSFSQSLSDGLKELFFKVNVSSILKEADDNTIMAISKLPSDFTNLLMRISWNFENGPSTYFDLIYKKERGTIESLLADKIDLPVENISEFLKNFSIFIRKVLENIRIKYPNIRKHQLMELTTNWCFLGGLKSKKMSL